MRRSILLAFLLSLYVATETNSESLLVEEASETQPVKVVDEFEGKATLEWTIRNPDPEHYGYDKKPGALTIVMQKGGVYKSAKNCKNLFLLPNPLEGGKDFEVTTCLVDFKPTAAWHQAGLVCFNDEDNYLKFVCEYATSAPHRKLTLIRETQGEVSPHANVNFANPTKRVWLRLTRRGSRYAYASSVDGKSFQVHGQLSWGTGAPKWIGLIAKNSDNDEESQVDASFDSFALRERLPSERPVFLYSMPSSSRVDDLLSFIVDLREFRPESPQELARHNQRAQALLQTAAQRILQQEKDQWSTAYQTALLVLLEDRIRQAVRVAPQQQQQTIDLVKMFLRAKIEEGKKPLQVEDVDLAISIGGALENAGNFELATKAYRELAEVVGKNDNRELAEPLAMLEGAARRLSLEGKELKLETLESENAEFDWAAYRGKSVLVLFWSSKSEPSLLDMRHTKTVHSLYRDRGFDVLAICIDPKCEAAEQLLEKEELPWTVLLAKDAEARHPIVTHYGVTTPTAMLVDREGRIASLRIRGEALDKWLADSIGPPCVPSGELVFVDLPSKANRKLSDQIGNISNNDLKDLPQGEQTFAGVSFSISDALMQLSGLYLKGRPEKIEGLSIGKTFQRLYLLHGNAWNPEDGTAIGKYQVNYEGGAVETIPIVYGKDTRDWNTNSDRKPAAASVVAWTGSNTYVRSRNGTIRLYLGIWDNPRPKDRVESIDFISANSEASPFCVAMTVEQYAE